jgi:cytochrome c oxidase assembly protein subunit 15
MMMNISIHRLAKIAAIVAFCVIVLGAWVRLSHAGLGCPDWPGCYGQLTWPDAPEEIAAANQAFPDRPVDLSVAWREMVHRYLAGALVLLVLGLNILAWRPKSSFRTDEQSFRGITGALLALILFQAALGMWTVTLKLWPIIVLAHLIGGFTTLGLLTWLTFRSGRQAAGVTGWAFRSQKSLVTVTIIVLAVQITLGGWTSANYSALACPDFPACQGQAWPETDFSEAFVLWREIGVDYEGGVLDLDARTAIHMTHRIGAVVAFLVLLVLAFRLIGQQVSRPAGLLLLVLASAQVTLGIMNIVLALPLTNAVAHNAMAAVLMALLIWLLHRAKPFDG